MTQSESKMELSFDPVHETRTILACGRIGSLASLNPDGSPLATLVTYAPLMNGCPIFLLSRLSAHTQNLLKDRRASFLVSTTGKGDPLAHARISINGQVYEITDEGERARCRHRFLARHPKAKLYVDFGDFSFWQLQIDTVHFNGGFAKAAQLSGADIIYPEAQIAMLAQDETSIISMIEQALKTSKIISFDPLGFDFMQGDEIKRQFFSQKITKAEQLKAELAAMILQSTKNDC